MPGALSPTNSSSERNAAKSVKSAKVSIGYNMLCEFGLRCVAAGGGVDCVRKKRLRVGE